MTEENKNLLSSRVKSFAWRFLMLLVVGFIQLIAENLGLFNLPDQMVVVLGLILGEVSKYITNNSKIALGKRLAAKNRV